MKLLRIYPDNLDVNDDYTLTVNPQCKPMRDAVGQKIEVKAVALLEDVSVTDGEVLQFARILTPEGECYGTSSPSFIKALLTAWDFADRREVDMACINVQSGRSKAGREFITCSAQYK